MATGNDTRAVESGAHSFACRNGQIEPLTRYVKNENGDLEGSITIPFPVGTVGGVASVHPIAPISRKILGITKAQELGRIMAALGLAQNFAALKALSDHSGFLVTNAVTPATNVAPPYTARVCSASCASSMQSENFSQYKDSLVLLSHTDIQSVHFLGKILYDGISIE